MNRLFLALTPDTQTALAIERWRELNWPHLQRPTPAQNYHVTLCFLGSLLESQQRVIEAGMHDLPELNHPLALDDVGYWPEQEILYLGCKEVPAWCTELAAVCQHVAQRANVKVSKRAFVPHLTLARRCIDPPGPLVTPEFSFLAESVTLYSSVLDRDGPRYTEQFNV